MAQVSTTADPQCPHFDELASSARRPSSEDSEMKTPFASDDERLHLLDLTSDELRHWLDERGYPAFRNGQIWAWVMQRWRVVRWDERFAEEAARRARQ
ncbi:MAG: hypothetical protein R3C56_28485 [Pirellulaceae bacterium]